MESMTLFAVANLPLVEPGDDIAALIVSRLHDQGESLQPGDILVIAQKIVSKAEGRLVRVDEVVVDPETVELAEKVDKDERVVRLRVRHTVSGRTYSTGFSTSIRRGIHAQLY